MLGLFLRVPKSPRKRCRISATLRHSFKAFLAAIYFVLRYQSISKSIQQSARFRILAIISIELLHSSLYLFISKRILFFFELTPCSDPEWDFAFTEANLES